MIDESPSRRNWKKFKRNRPAFAAMLLVMGIALTGLAGYLVIPDQTPLANDMHLQLGIKKPGRAFTFLNIPKKEQVARVSVWKRMLFGQASAYRSIPVTSCQVAGDSLRFREYIGDDEIAEPGAIHLRDLCGQRVFRQLGSAGTTARMAYLEQQGYIYQQRFLLGSDAYGRDLLSRLVLGIRVSLAVGGIAVLISLLIGVWLGAAAGYYGGRIDLVISWLMNVVWSLPALLLVIAISFALGKGFWQVFIAVGLSMWVDVARLVRGQVLSLKSAGYVEAARAMGFSDLRIIGRHILPNIRGPVLVIASSNFASAILLEAGMSFLGFGVQPPTPSWGGMIREHYGYIIMDAAYLALLPGMAIMVTVYAFNLVTTGLRDAFDVRSQNGNYY